MKFPSRRMLSATAAALTTAVGLASLVVPSRAPAQTPVSERAYYADAPAIYPKVLLRQKNGHKDILRGVRVDLYRNGRYFRSATTGNDGVALFKNLPIPAHYTVKVQYGGQRHEQLVIVKGRNDRWRYSVIFNAR